MSKLIIEIDLPDGLSEESAEVLANASNNPGQLELIIQLLANGYSVHQTKSPASSLMTEDAYNDIVNLLAMASGEDYVNLVAMALIHRDDVKLADEVPGSISGEMVVAGPRSYVEPSYTYPDRLFTVTVSHVKL